MPHGTDAKATKAQRAATGLTKEDLLLSLADDWRTATGRDKRALGLELLPYFAPRLKAVDITQTQDVKVTISIGGVDATDPG